MHKQADPDPRRALLDKLDAAGRAGRRARSASRGSTRPASSPRASGSTCSSIPARSSSSTSSRPTAAPTSAWSGRRCPATASSPGTASSRGGRSFVFAQDFTVFGGSLSGALRREDLQGDGPRDGGRLPGRRPERLGRRAHPGGRRRRSPATPTSSSATRSRRGVVPQISVILGPCAGGAVYSPAITDFIFMVKDTAYMFITGPDVIKAVTHEEVTKEDLGGARTHATRSASRTSRSTPRRRRSAPVRELLSFLPPNNADDPPPQPCSDDVRRARRARARRRSSRTSPSKPYDMQGRHPRGGRRPALLRGRRALRREHRRRLRAPRRPRRSGSSRTSPRCSPACSTSTRRVKAARFVRFCDAFNVPLAHARRRPGFLPGTDQEWAASSSTARSSSTRSPRRRCRRSPSSRARRTAARTT